jgi:hypothetical protein
MATITIRNLSQDIVDNLRALFSTWRKTLGYADRLPLAALSVRSSFSAVAARVANRFSARLACRQSPIM